MVIELEDIPGIGKVTSKRLRTGGILTGELLAFQDAKFLEDRVALSESKLHRLICNARDMLSSVSMRSATDLEEEMRNRSRLSTGIPFLDRKLHGGFLHPSVIEIHGVPGSGKTQWCHQLAVTSQLPEEDGGLDGRVLWLDTERGLSPLALRVDAKRFGLDPDEVMASIRHVPILSQDHLVDYLGTLAKLCSEDTSLVICDCLGTLCAAEIEERRYYEYSRNMLRTALRTFFNLSLTTDTTFLYTNQLYTRLLKWGGSYLYPLNNNVMGQMSQYRFRTHTPSKSTDPKYFNLVAAVDIPPFKFRARLLWGGFYERGFVKPPEEVLEYVNNELAEWYEEATEVEYAKPLYT